MTKKTYDTCLGYLTIAMLTIIVAISAAGAVSAWKFALQ